MIQTGSDLALTDTGVNFKKIPWFQEVTMWNTHDMCEDLLTHCTATSMVACVPSTCILVMAPDWTKEISKYERLKTNLWDYLNARLSV